MPVVVEKVADAWKLGEGPHWDVDTQSVYFVDIFEKSINKYTPSTKTHTKAIIGGHVSFIIPIEGSINKYLISMEREVVTITRDGINDKVANIQEVAKVETDEGSINNKLNDAKCDASGRLWCGTMGRDPETQNITPNAGSVYSVNAEGSVKHHLSSISISNGLAWNSDNTKFYYIDSATGEIQQYDFDLANETMGNKKIVFNFAEVGVEGFPDGQTIDTDGNLWIAVFNGSRVIKIDPRKYNTLLETIDMPT